MADKKKKSSWAPPATQIYGEGKIDPVVEAYAKRRGFQIHSLDQLEKELAPKPVMDVPPVMEAPQVPPREVMPVKPIPIPMPAKPVMRPRSSWSSPPVPEADETTTPQIYLDSDKVRGFSESFSGRKK